MTEHPHELLAEYVEDALGPEDRARVEAHLDGCASCRREVEEARSAHRALASIPEVEEPPGLTLDVLREARERRPGGARWAGGAKVAAIAAAIALVFGGAGYLLVRDGGEPQGAAPRAGGDAAAPQSEEGGPALASDALPYPELRSTDEAHDADSIRLLASELADEARQAIEGGLPPDAFSFYEIFDPDAADPSVRRALRCAARGLERERSLVPFVIEAARWEDAPVFVTSFLAGPAPAAPYDHIQILVVDRESCGLLHFARQSL